MSDKTTRAVIDEFLAQKRVAIVGVPRDPKEFGSGLFREFRQRGYNVFPVNPKADTIEGERCYKRVQDIQPPVEAAMLLTSPNKTEEVARDCAAAGVKYVWFYGVSDRSAENAQAIKFCQEHGMRVIPGFCPLMYLHGTNFGHQAHGFVARIIGQAP